MSHEIPSLAVTPGMTSSTRRSVLHRNNQDVGTGVFDPVDAGIPLEDASTGAPDVLAAEVKQNLVRCTEPAGQAGIQLNASLFNQGVTLTSSVTENEE